MFVIIEDTAENNLAQKQTNATFICPRIGEKVVIQDTLYLVKNITHFFPDDELCITLERTAHEG